MRQYIDKETLVAEIKSLYQKAIELYGYSQFNTAYNNVLESIDTLEVKEVDLEKELNDFIEQQKAFVNDDRVVEYNNGDTFNHIYDLLNIAKHFFKLGLNAQKGE